MKLSCRYQTSSRKPEPLWEYLIKIQILYYSMTVQQPISREEARQYADYALESPAILPCSSAVQAQRYEVAGWKRKLSLFPRLSTVVRDGEGSC